MKKRLISFFMAFLVLFGLSAEVSQATCVSTPVQKPTGTLILTKRDAETNKALRAAYFRIWDSKGNFVTNISSNGADYDSENGNIYTSGIQRYTGIAAGTYYLEEIVAPPGYELLAGRTQFTITANQTTRVTIKDKALPTTGTLKITKTDASTGAVLSGAEFTVTDSAGTAQTKTTDSSGTATFSDLKPGSVSINERKAPTGYVANSSTTSATIVANQQSDITIKNTKQQAGSLKITKTDATNGKVLSGAEFTITDSKGTSQSAITDTNGNANFSNLPAGKVTIKETKAPVGYIANNNDSTATIENDKQATITITNKKDQLYGSLKITKVDSANTNTKLSGAEFSITDSIGKTQTGKTDASGNLEFTKVATGSVSIKETKAPTGYIAASSVPNATISADKQTSITVKNTKEAQKGGSLKLIVVETDTDTVLSGAEFDITDSAGNVHKATSDASGTIILNNLPSGYATVKQTKAPAGYYKATNAIRTRIVDNFERIEFIENEPYRVLLEIKAVDQDNKPVEGVKVLAYSRGISTDGTTDANGKFLSISYLGDGNAKIISLPDGYTAKVKSIDFTNVQGESKKSITFELEYDDDIAD